MPETEAIAFNPFDEDDDEDEYGGTELQALIDNLAGIDYPATMATMAQPNADDAPGATADPSAKYRKIALEEFRKRRTDSRSGRIVADGMVTLPFVALTDPLTVAVPPGIGEMMGTLERTVETRLRELPEGSYVAKLHARGLGYVSQKVVEEAGESIVAALQNKPGELVGEAADLLFHLTVLLRESGVSLQDVAAKLAERHAGAATVK